LLPTFAIDILFVAIKQNTTHISQKGMTQQFH
jgi:hypothetical protein